MSVTLSSPLFVASDYAPHVNCEIEEKGKFWSELGEMTESIPRKERMLIGANYNRHVGEGSRCDV